MSRTLVRGGCVLTMARTNHPEADVLIDGDTIVEVGSRIRARDAEVVDASSSIVMPGFVDAHRHTSSSLLRHLDDAPSPAIPPGSRPDDVYAATLIGLLAAADAGITTVVDWCSVAGHADNLSAVISAHDDSGVRSVLVIAPPDDGEPWQEAISRATASSVSPATSVAAGISVSQLSGLAAAEADIGFAREQSLRIHLHLDSKSRDDGFVGGVATRGLLGEDITIVHGSYLSDADFDPIAVSGSRVVLAPASEMTAGLGAPPIQELIDRGIEPGLAVGTERLAPGDMFAQMRAVISIQHATRFDLKLAGKAGLPRLMTTRDVLRRATVDGARAVGLERETGTVEEGKRADIAVLRTDRPNIFPINDPIGAVAWGMDTSNVEWVFVGGRAVKRHGRLTADIDRARSLAVEARSRLLVAGRGAASITGGPA